MGASLFGSEVYSLQSSRRRDRIGESTLCDGMDLTDEIPVGQQLAREPVEFVPIVPLAKVVFCSSQLFEQTRIGGLSELQHATQFFCPKSIAMKVVSIKIGPGREIRREREYSGSGIEAGRGVSTGGVPIDQRAEALEPSQNLASPATHCPSKPLGEPASSCPEFLQKLPPLFDIILGRPGDIQDQSGQYVHIAHLSSRFAQWNDGFEQPPSWLCVLKLESI